MCPQLPQLLTSVIVFVQDPPLDPEEPPEALAPVPEELPVDPPDPPEAPPDEAPEDPPELLPEEPAALPLEPPDDAPPPLEPSIVASSSPPSASVTSEKPQRFAHAGRATENAAATARASAQRPAIRGIRWIVMRAARSERRRPDRHRRWARYAR
jgi:hypothetical protein